MHAAVVGAGIMGSLMALGLYNQGWQVTVFDEQSLDKEPSNCSQAAAGLLAPVSELDKAEALVHRLGLESLHRYWPAILQQLHTPIYFKQEGSLVVHHPSDWHEWQKYTRRISQHLGQDFYRTLGSEKLQELEPELTAFDEAYFISDEGQLDSQGVLRTLGQYLRIQGVGWEDKVCVSRVRAGCIVVKGLHRKFDWVFDCRGLGSKLLIPELRGLRGELIWLHAPEVCLKRPIRLLHPRYSLYLVPRPGQHYILGASELETEDCSPISVRSTLELLTAAYSLHAGFSEARIIKTVTQCRPCLPDHRPCIRFWDGLTAVNGLYRHGYLIGPALVQEVLRKLPAQTLGLCYPELWEFYRDQHLFKPEKAVCSSQDKYL